MPNATLDNSNVQTTFANSLENSTTFIQRNVEEVKEFDAEQTKVLIELLNLVGMCNLSEEAKALFKQYNIQDKESTGFISKIFERIFGKQIKAIKDFWKKNKTKIIISGAIGTALTITILMLL